MRWAVKGRELTEPTDRFVKVRGIHLRYVDWGGDGPVMLLLHGDMRTSRSWDAVSRRLTADYRVIALDMRGHGDSDWTPRGYRFSERVDDLAAFCDAMKLHEVIGVAHSTGGVVMALCAQKHPGTFSQLALMEPMVVVDDRFHKMVAGREHAERSTWKSRDELHDYLKQHPATSNWHPEVLRGVVAHEAFRRDDGLYDMKWSSFTFNWKDRDGDHVDLKPVFAQLGLPILFIRSSGHQTRIRELNEVQDGIPDFYRLTIENTGHNMYMERPEAIADALKLFAAAENIPAAL